MLFGSKLLSNINKLNLTHYSAL